MNPSLPVDWREANRANWDERATVHAASDFYDLDGFRRAPILPHSRLRSSGGTPSGTSSWPRSGT
jgi:hypothetical protein